jgi:hypothetical protein
MTQLTDNEIYAVKVPEGAKNIHCEISMTGNPYIAYKFKDDELLNEYEIIDLPAGSYEFLFCTSEVSEEQARKVVLKIDMGFKDVFLNYAKGGAFDYDTALESLRSLLKANGCEGEWAVVRKNIKY